MTETNFNLVTTGADLQDPLPENLAKRYQDRPAVGVQQGVGLAKSTTRVLLWNARGERMGPDMGLLPGKLSLTWLLKLRGSGGLKELKVKPIARVMHQCGDPTSGGRWHTWRTRDW